MRPTLVLWDIDGTILRGGGIGQRVLEAAFREVLGLGDDATLDLGQIPFGGNTDQAIIGDGLELHGHLAAPVLVDAIGSAYLRRLEAEVAAKNPFRRLPGVLEVVDAIAHGGAHQGLGTGNLEAAAWLKVGAVQLGGRFRYGGFGSDAKDRGELLRIGRDRGAAQLGHSPEACRVIIVGDTLRDIAAARAIGAEVVAVATGGLKAATLREAAPELCFESFADPAVAHAIGRFADEG